MGSIDRRAFVASLAGAALTSKAQAQSGAAATPPRFGFDDVVRRARDLASEPLTASPPLPEALAKLDPEAARDIRFRPERALLAGPGSQFRLQPIHLSPRSPRAITVNVIRDGIATPIPYAANLFDYGRVKFERPLPLNLGFAGFRLQFPLNDPRGFDDAMTFSELQRIRLLGRGQRAGASLRAVTLNAGAEAEEFPFFREYWVDTPEPNAVRATIFALLDGESLTGAFRFDLSPGAESRVEVGATLFPRRAGGVLGLAPIASMFLAGENERPLGALFPPEVHDSDGLALHTGAGERLWRPLRNPAQAGRFQFIDRAPKGFGLMQRDRAFDHYQDLAQAWERRPSYWVEPVAEWGQGYVHLIEQPADDSGAANIHAAWVSASPRTPGVAITYGYRVTARLEPPRSRETGRVVETFDTPASGAGPGAVGRSFVIDFNGGDLDYYLGDPKSVEIVASANNGRATQTQLSPNPHIRGFRASVTVEAAPGETADIRVFLQGGGRALTETWTSPWTA